MACTFLIAESSSCKAVTVLLDALRFQALATYLRHINWSRFLLFNDCCQFGCAFLLNWQYPKGILLGILYNHVHQLAVGWLFSEMHRRWQGNICARWYSLSKCLWSIVFSIAHSVRICELLGLFRFPCHRVEEIWRLQLFAHFIRHIRFNAESRLRQCSNFCNSGRDGVYRKLKSERPEFFDINDDLFDDFWARSGLDIFRLWISSVHAASCWSSTDILLLIELCLLTFALDFELSTSIFESSIIR